MKVCGIIVEHNPFHNGHLYHINKAKEVTNSDYIIAVMSGNFAQRGIPSIIDKWIKTEIILNNGVDLVIELPILYTISSAEFFSYGAISLLDSLGIVNNICFGCENSEINTIQTIAQLFANEPNDFKKILKNYIGSGLSFPHARNNALKEYLLNKKLNTNFEIDQFLNNSNNILGIEYCKSIIKLNSNIKPYTIKRLGSSYHDLSLNHNFSSASAIREHIKNNGNFNIISNYIPDNTFKILNKLRNYNYDFTFEENMFPYIKYKCMLYSNDLRNIPDVKEGIENKILKEIYNAKSLNDLILRVKSKRFTYTRVSRILAQFFIGFDKFNTSELRKMKCPYARVLGFNSNGRNLLKIMKSNSNIPIYTKLPNKKNDTLKLDIQSTIAYSLINKNISPNSDLLNSVIIKK